MRNNTKILTTAKTAATSAAKLIMPYFKKGIEMRHYEGQTHNLVSDADLESEKIIVETIRKTFPEHQFLGEESHTADANAEQLWIIDPIDGTNNFAHSVPHFAISIAYCERGETKVGLVYNPAREELFTAIKGQGAFLNDEQISVSKVESLDKALVSTGFYYDRGKMMEDTLASIHKLFSAGIHGIRRWGTASLDLSYLACGRFDAYFEYQLSPWDFAAGMLIVEEAGGLVQNCEGEKLALEKSSVFAVNSLLRDQFLTLIKRK